MEARDKTIKERNEKGVENKELNMKALTEDELRLVDGAGKAEMMQFLDEKDDPAGIADYAKSTLSAIKVAQDFFGGLKNEK